MSSQTVDRKFQKPRQDKTMSVDGLRCILYASIYIPYMHTILYYCIQTGSLVQRFSNWGPRTKGGPRRVPAGSARGFRNVVIVCTVFNNLRPMCFQICTHKSVTQSQCIATQCSAKPRQHFHAMIAWKCCRGLARQAFC